MFDQSHPRIEHRRQKVHISATKDITKAVYLIYQATHWLVYSVFVNPSSNFWPSASNLVAEMNGCSPGQEEILGSFLFRSWQQRLNRVKLNSNHKQKILARGSDMPRVCTRITLWANFMADSFTPWLTLGAHTNSNIRALESDNVVHEAGLFRLVHLY